MATKKKNAKKASVKKGKDLSLKSKQFLTIGDSAISIKSVTEIKNLFWVLRNPMKLKIIETIYKAGNAGIYVQDIQEAIGLNQSHTSIHLRELRKTNLVDRKRAGKFVVYNIQAATFKSISQVIDFITSKGLIQLKKP